MNETTTAAGWTGQNPGSWKKPLKAYYRSLDPLLIWNMADRPMDWTGAFGRSAPIELEIGFGNGEAIVRRAKEQPDVDFVGFELAWSSIKRALRRTTGEKLENVRLVQVDAQLGLQYLFRPETIDRACALFPVPWPKDRHEKRRLFSNGFLKLMNNRMTGRGVFQIVTDFEPLKEWVLTQVEDSGFNVEWKETPALFNTKYERKWQSAGQDHFYEIVLNKERHIDVPLPEDNPLNTLFVDEFEPERFEPVGVEGPVTVKFKDYIYDSGRRHGMLRTLVFEDKLVQDFFIKIVEENGRWIIGLAQARQVVPTEGVKRALEIVHACAAKRL